MSEQPIVSNTAAAPAPPVPLISAASPAQRWFVPALLAIWLLLYGSFTLFTPPLLDDADSVHAEVAREMVARHDWVTLYANGIRYLEKAPLLYWSMAASFTAFGGKDWAARLPLALAMLALLLAVYHLGRTAFASALAGFYAALILATSFGPFIFTRILIPDIAVCLWLTLGMLFFWRIVQSGTPRPADCYGFAITCALDVLTKGLIGLVFPLAIALLYLLLTHDLRRLARMRLLSGTLLFLLIAAPWHLLAGIRNPTQGHPGPLPTDGNVHGWFWFYFVNEHILRYLNRRVPRDYDTVPLLLFWGLLLVWLLPWSIYLPGALRRLPISRFPDPARLTTPQRFLMLAFVWAAFIMLFFSFSTRQEYYVLPALPALALLIAHQLQQEDRPQSNTSKATAAVTLIIGLLLAVIAGFYAITTRTPPPGTDISALLKQNPSDYALSFGHFLDLSGKAMGAFRLPLAITALAFGIGSIGNFTLRRSRRLFAANLTLAASAIAFLVAAHMALVTFSPVLSSKALADSIRPRLSPADVIVLNGEYESGSTLSFYLHRQVRILNGRSSNLWYGSFFPDAPRIFDDDTSFAALWRGPQRVFLFTPSDQVPAAAQGSPAIAQSGGKGILTNR